MWFNIRKLDLSQLTTQIQGDSDADSINIQRDDKCKKKLLKVIEIMKDTDRKARQALPNILKEVSKESEYKNKSGGTITFKIADFLGEDTIVAENSRYRFGFSISSELGFTFEETYDNSPYYSKQDCIEKIKNIMESNDIDGDDEGIEYYNAKNPKIPNQALDQFYGGCRNDYLIYD